MLTSLLDEMKGLVAGPAPVAAGPALAAPGPAPNNAGNMAQAAAAGGVVQED
jgi:hypothetical protein